MSSPSSDHIAVDRKTKKYYVLDELARLCKSNFNLSFLGVLFFIMYEKTKTFVKNALIFAHCTLFIMIYGQTGFKTPG